MRVPRLLSAFLTFYWIVDGEKDAPLLPSVRPAPNNRTFTSTVVDNYIAETAPRFKSQNLSILWSNCLPNTLDTTVAHHDGRLDAFVITGDIDAMWLRDSANQALPYARFLAVLHRASRAISPGSINNIHHSFYRRAHHSILCTQL